MAVSLILHDFDKVLYLLILERLQPPLIDEESCSHLSINTNASKNHVWEISQALLKKSFGDSVKDRYLLRFHNGSRNMFLNIGESVFL